MDKCTGTGILSDIMIDHFFMTDIYVYLIMIWYEKIFLSKYNYTVSSNEVCGVIFAIRIDDNSFDMIISTMPMWMWYKLSYIVLKLIDWDSWNWPDDAQTII